MIFEVAFIKWIDSTYYKIEFMNSDCKLDNLKPKILFTVGIFIYEDDDFITICQDFEPTTDSSRMVLSIPKVSIINYEIKKMKIKKFGEDTKK